MRSTTARLLISLLLICGFGFSSASYSISVKDIYFEELTLRDGLADVTILDIAEDKDGYIWIATLGGLHRYSGYEFKHYAASDDDPHSLPSSFVRELHIDANGELWVGTTEGIARYQPQQDNFVSFSQSNSALKDHNISSINHTVDNKMIFAAGTRLYALDESSSKPISYHSSLIFDSEIRTIHDEASKMFVGTANDGLFIWDKSEQKLYSAKNVNPWSIFVDAQTVHDIAVIDGDYWFGTNEGAFQVGANGKQKNIINAEKFPKLGTDVVFNIFSVGDQIWLGTDNNLSIYNPEAGEFESIGPESAELTGLEQRYILSYFKDSTGKIWLGTYDGLYFYNSKTAFVRFLSNEKAFQEKTDGNAIWGLREDHEGNIWFVTQSEGIGRFNPSTGSIKYFLEDLEVTMWDMFIDDKGFFWIATSSGVYVYDIDENGKQTLVKVVLENNFIDSFVVDKAKLWVFIRGEKFSLIAINTKLLLEDYSIQNKSQFIELHELDIKKPNLTATYADDEGRIWLNSFGYLGLYDPIKQEIVKTLSNEADLSSKISHIHEWRNAYWLLSLNGTIMQYNKKSLELKRQAKMNDEIAVAISAINVGNEFWVSGDKSIMKIDLLRLKIIDEVHISELNYNDFYEESVLKLSNGNIVFGGAKGFNIIEPEKVAARLDPDRASPSPHIINIRIFGTEKNSGEPTNLLYKQQSIIALNSDESRFSIGYELVNPSNAELVNYRYRLSGYDEDWIDAEGLRFAQFNNIPFGQYTFEVQAKERNEQWSASATQQIVVGRPPWLHTAALVFYAVVISAFLLFILRQYQIRKQNQQAIKESEERLKLTLWSSGDELWDWDVYRGQVYRSNTWGTLDFPQDNIRTTSAYDANIHPNDILRVQETLKAHLEGHSEYYELAYRAKTFNNQWIWILDRGKVVARDHNAQPVRMTGTLKNIHHLKEAEEQLNLFKRSIENISEGVFITSTNFKFISVNNAYCTYTGETRDQALASYLYFHQYPEPFTEEIKKTLKVKGNWFGEVETARVNGEKFEIELNIDAVHDEDGKISHFVGVFSDITSRKNTEKELLKLANADPLTDLPNRSFFQASHQNLVRRAETHALLCLDMDNFKKINDSLGHQTGDVLIKQIAKRIQRMSGTAATCYRLGGDEFSILLEDRSDIHTITHFAQGLLDTLSRPFIINKQEFVLGASIGIAFYPEDGASSQEMLKNADTAMYFAKNNGGNSYKFFSGEMNQNAVRQLQIENLIRQGIKDDLFTVYYQPKVDISTGRLVSMEALVRFEHPSKGIVSPGQFIPLAEQTGQIIEIGEQVLRKALTDTKRWVSEGIFSGRVAVNISAKQFELPDLDDRIIRILNEVGLSPLHLECELTEGTLMENPEQGLRMMERLRERGIHLALDDFGTGYSSLAYLKRFPLNTLKIDKAFIDDIANSNVDRHMAASIINIAHNLGLKVVAEGVEHENQLSILRRYECEMLQGYLYSKPLPADRFEHLLNENQQLHELISRQR